MNKVAKTLLIISLLTFCNIIGIVAQNLSVFVSAQPDDWQLFMNPNAFKQLSNSDQKVIFLHLTAGDAGIAASSYYLAREEGSLRAIRFIINTLSMGAAGLGNEVNPIKVDINGHALQKFSYANAVIYFLRLPDGNNDGLGYASHNYQSLQNIYSGSAISISAIDTSTTYNSLNDLENTIQQIISSELNGGDSIQLNIADNDLLLNPGDHPDRLASSLIIQQVANLMERVTINLYQGYITSTKPQNVFGNDYLISIGTWGATASGLSEKGANSNWDKSHNAFIGKQYFRALKP